MSRTVNHCKPWNKAPKFYKRMLKKIRRAKDKDALRHGKDAERYHKTDSWNWV